MFMHTPPSQPAERRRRLLGVAMALPLLAVGAVTAPARAATSTTATDTGISVEGRYNTVGASCHGSDNAEGCLNRRVHVPSTIAPRQRPTVTTEAVLVDGTAKDTARFTMKAKNDSTTPMSDFTINASRSSGRAQVAALTCDLTAFGGEVVSANGPAESLTVPSGKATVPSGKEITCQVDLTGVVGRNTVTAGITTDGQSFAANYVDNRPVGEVTAQSSQNSTEAAPTGTSQIVVEYTVTFTNKTDAEGRTSDIVLRPHLPAGIALRNVWGTGVPWRVDVGAYMLQEDGSIPLPTGDPMPGDSTTTMTFWNTYEVNADAITEEEWEALGTCNPKDPSKGLTTQIDVADSGAGIEAKSFAVCTTVTRAKN